MSEYQEKIDISEEKKLLTDFASIQHRQEFHDVKFICKDGIILGANRAILGARCDFFYSLLYGTMKESQETEITLPTISSSSLSLVFEYLYTCHVTILESNTMAVEAYDLARQYNLPGLQNLIIEYLVSHVIMDSNLLDSSIGAIISKALQLEAYEVAQRLMPIISSALEEGNIALFYDFSVISLEYILKSHSLRAGRPFESVIFNAVLFWAISKYLDINNMKCQKLITNSKIDLESLDPSDLIQLRNLLTDTNGMAYKEWRSVLECIRFDCIPTDSLEYNVERLELVPVDILLRAYRTQAKKFAKVALKSSLWDVTCRGSQVRIEQDLCDFQSKSHQGARTQTPFEFGIHRFDFKIEKYCDLVWVGVVDSTVNMNDWLGKQEGGWMFGSNATLCHHTCQDNGPYNNKYAIPFRDEAVITVCLDMNKREMGFIVNGVDYGIAFKNLSKRVYPAVSCRAPGLIKVSFGEKLWALLDTPSRSNSGLLNSHSPKSESTVSHS